MFLKTIKKIFLLLLLSSPLFGQWVNNPSTNTRLIIDVVDPKNILSVDDNKGGTYIFWEDKKDKQSDIFFQHINENGMVSFRADGKKVSEKTGNKLLPAAASTIAGNAMVLWEDYSENKNGDLLVQKVTANGGLLWFDGIKVNKNLTDLKEYSINSDAQSNVFISYVGKNQANEQELVLQKLSSTGRKLFSDKNGIVLTKSKSAKTSTSILPDDKGGMFVFWNELSGKNNILYGQRIDSTGNLQWGKKPIQISSNVQDVFTYSVYRNSFNNVYICWQIQNSDKDIYHQLLTQDGKVQWGPLGKLITAQKGNQINPQAVLSDSSIFISWTSDINNDRNIYVQKFDLKGNYAWKEIPVIDVTGDQFGQKIVGDNNEGAIIGWIDKRVDSLRANVYAQRIASDGRLLWDAQGIQIATHPNTDKSYISIISDNIGGAIFTFKEKRQKSNEIFGQKVFNTGTYVSQIKGFKLQNTGDSILLTWEALNESDKTIYNIERLDNESNKWTVVGSLNSAGKGSSKTYNYYDTPVPGTNYYRIVQKDGRNNLNLSDVLNVNFFESSSDIVVAQNNPNPFKNTTKINFYLPSQTKVKIEFFDSRVEKIKEVNEVFPSGQNEYVFTENDLKPGIYFYRFQAGKFVEVKKMIVSSDG